MHFSCLHSFVLLSRHRTFHTFSPLGQKSQQMTLASPQRKVVKSSDNSETTTTTIQHYCCFRCRRRRAEAAKPAKAQTQTPKVNRTEEKSRSLKAAQGAGFESVPFSERRSAQRSCVVRSPYRAERANVPRVAEIPERSCISSGRRPKQRERHTTQNTTIFYRSQLPTRN